MLAEIPRFPATEGVAWPPTAAQRLTVEQRIVSGDVVDHAGARWGVERSLGADAVLLRNDAGEVVCASPAAISVPDALAVAATTRLVGKLTIPMRSGRRTPGGATCWWPWHACPVEAVITDAVEHHYAKANRPSLLSLCRNVAERCRVAGLQAPSYRAVQARVRAAGQHGEPGPGCSASRPRLGRQRRCRTGPGPLQPAGSRPPGPRRGRGHRHRPRRGGRPRRARPISRATCLGGSLRTQRDELALHRDCDPRSDPSSCFPCFSMAL